jgi:thiosulfate reductase cytochrome b subunit
MIWSGLLIYWANDEYTVTIAGHTIVRFFPDWFYKLLNIPQRLAEGMAFHFLFMWLFAINGLLYILYTIFSGAWRQLLPNKLSFKEAWLVLLHDLHNERLYRRKTNTTLHNALLIQALLLWALVHWSPA